MMDAATQSSAASSDKLRRADPCSFVIFGAAGDLTKRLLLPALYNLAAAELLPERFCLIGVARHEMSDEEFRRQMEDALKKFAPGPVKPKLRDDLLSCCRYVKGDFDDQATYESLNSTLAATGRSVGARANCLFYLATLPDLFAHVAQSL